MPNNASDIRALDQLGRVVLPKFIRNQLNLSEGDQVSIRLEGRQIILEPFNQGCIFCGSHDGVEEYKGKMVCQSCREELGKSNK